MAPITVTASLSRRPAPIQSTSIDIPTHNNQSQLAITNLNNLYQNSNGTPDSDNELLNDDQKSSIQDDSPLLSKEATHHTLSTQYSNMKFDSVQYYSNSRVICSNISESILYNINIVQRQMYYNIQKLPNNMLQYAATQLQQQSINNDSNIVINNNTLTNQPGNSPAIPSLLSRATSDPSTLSFAGLNIVNNTTTTSQVQTTQSTWSSAPGNKRPHLLPLVSGWLYMCNNAGQFNRVWVEYVDGILAWRTDESTRKPTGVIELSYCELEQQPNNCKIIDLRQNESNDALDGLRQQLVTLNASTNNVNTNVQYHSAHSTLKYEELYWSYLASSKYIDPITNQEATIQAHPGRSLPPVHSFIVYSHGRVYLFKTDSLHTCHKFVDVIRAQLHELQPAAVYQEKQVASRIVSSMIHEQFILQLYRYQILLRALSRSDVQEDELPITSTRKDKSGVLCMETPNDISQWRDYYFVLFEGALFYYKDSKSTTPTGFIALRYASVQLDTKRIARDEYVFRVVTPSRTIVCRTKHSVALTEWITVLESTLYTQSTKPKIQRAVSDNSRYTSNERAISDHSNNNNNQPLSPKSAQQYPPNIVDNRSVWISRRKNSSSSLTNDIEQIKIDVHTFDNIMNNITALDHFRHYLSDAKGSCNILEYYIHTIHFYQLPQPPTQLQQSQSGPTIPTAPPTQAAAHALNNATQIAMNKYLLAPASPFNPPVVTTQNEVLNYALAIHEKYINHDSIDYLHDVPNKLLNQVTEHLGILQLYNNLSHSLGSVAHVILGSICVGIYDSVRRYCYQLLCIEFQQYQQSHEYQQLYGDNNNTRYGLSTAVSNNDINTNNNNTIQSSTQRHVEPFDAHTIPWFILKQKNEKQSREIKISKKRNVLTIGRDKSNTLVIEDSRVSRSHARIEWNESECTCEYIDLGSSCGSKLNGKLVERCKLQPGDVLELGQSTLIFQLKKKRRFSLF